MNKILVFGGTFNPITNAHVSLALKALQDMKADKLIFIPTGTKFLSSYKQMNHQDILDDSFRLSCMHKVLDEYSQFIICTNEIEGKVYRTYDELALLKKQYQDSEFIWLCGDDKIDDFKNWYNYEQLLKEYKFAIYSRENDYDISQLDNTYLKDFKDNITLLKIDGYQDISSTKVRMAMLNQDKDYIEQCCDAKIVNDLIEKGKTMKDYGNIKVGCSYFETSIADIKSNVKNILDNIDKASKQDISLLVFSELSLTGYTCADLFYKNYLLQQVIDGLITIKNDMADNIVAIVGAPLVYGNKLYNCGVAIKKGQILAIVPKSYIPNYNEFYELRWFASGINIKDTYITIGNEKVGFGIDQLIKIDNAFVGIEICEDLWVADTPSTKAVLNGAHIIANLSASNDVVSKDEYRKSLVTMTSGRLYCGYIYASSGFGESSTDLVFSGAQLIANSGSLLVNTKEQDIASALIDIDSINHDRHLYHSSFYNSDALDYRIIDSNIKRNNTILLPENINAYPFIDSDADKRFNTCTNILHIQAKGLATRLKKINCHKVVLGISGGLDSTLALLVCMDAFDYLKYDHKDIICITMPGFGTTSRTKNNADTLMELAGVTRREIDIKQASIVHLNDIGHDLDKFDVTYENTQARERTQILMDIANANGAIVVGTGDLSELALGWCTYNGDHMSMYAVNASIPKTLVKYLVETYYLIHQQYKDVLKDIIDTPISPELLPSKDDAIVQKTEDSVGKYDLQDFFLYHYLRHGFSKDKLLAMAYIAFKNIEKETISNTLDIFYKRFYSQQFKRSCLPDGPKVGSVCLSPRGDWRMPSDASNKLEY